MVIGSTGAASPNTDNTLIFNNTGSNGSLDSFAQQLASVIEGYLGNSGNGSQFEIDVQNNAQSSSAQAGAQFTVTVKPISANPVAPTPVATTPETTEPTANATASTTPVAAASSTGENLTAPVDNSSMTPTDAYWAEQPAAVQALRYGTDEQKTALAQQLASEGYSIDVPIMVWGWDPLATMIERQTAGYTWVPSAMQPSAQIAPGVSMPGMTSYDPANPPDGSIQVSTAFADGTNIAADPVAEMWIQGQSSTSGSATTSL